MDLQTLCHNFTYTYTCSPETTNWNITRTWSVIDQTDINSFETNTDINSLETNTGRREILLEREVWLIKRILTHSPQCLMYSPVKWVSIGSDNGLSSDSAPSHCLNQCWLIVNWTLRNKFKGNSIKKTKLSIHKNAFENVICEMAAILSRERWVDISHLSLCVLSHNCNL